MEDTTDKHVRGDLDENKKGDHIERHTNDAENEEVIQQTEERELNDVAEPLNEDTREMEEPEKPEKPREIYNYTPLNFEKDEMRFLVLKSHPDGAGSLSQPDPVECSFSFSAPSESEPYTYVVNTRGNPLDWWFISIDGAIIWLTRNIAVFLSHIRSKESSKRLWFRDVCLNHKDVEEKSRYWNPKWMETMMKNADNIIDLSEIMGDLWDQGKLPQVIPPREKEWLRARAPKDPKHHPAPLELQVVPEGTLMPHKYLPLDYVLDEIRLVTLWKADNYTDPIQTSFSYKVLHDDTTYHCLSYTWGSEEANCPILLGHQTYHIRKNLDSFLRAVRTPVNKVVIWVDAICIDQNNITERNRQLSRMLEIYQSSDCVVSWIGEADATSDMALDLIEELKYCPAIREKENGEWDVKNPAAFPRQLAALYRLLLRPYFRRVWIIQELAVASLPVVICGSRKVPANFLDNAVSLLLDILHSDSNMPGKMMAADPQLESVSFRNMSFVRRMFYLRHLQARGKEDHFWEHVYADWLEIGEHSPGILDVVVMCRDFESTSPYDKVFALWNLARDTENMNFKMDYTRSLSDAWVEFATTVAVGNGSLDIVCAAEPVVQLELDIPSWCPDWSTPSTVSSLIRREEIPNARIGVVKDRGGPIYYAAGKGPLSARFSFNGRILECAGVIADGVRVVGPYIPDLPDEVRKDVFLEWINIVSTEIGFTNNHGPYLSETGLMSAFWSMLAGDVTGVWGVEESPLMIFPDGTSGTKIRTICIKPKELRHRLHNTEADVYAIVTRGRRLIITENGYMGLAPHYVEAGQRLAVLNCCSVPVLLHEIDNTTYRLAGSCFVQGWMEGEILDDLGSTPEESWEGIDLSGRLTIV